MRCLECGVKLEKQDPKFCPKCIEDFGRFCEVIQAAAEKKRREVDKK